MVGIVGYHEAVKRCIQLHILRRFNLLKIVNRIFLQIYSMGVARKADHDHTIGSGCKYDILPDLTGVAGFRIQLARVLNGIQLAVQDPELRACKIPCLHIFRLVLEQIDCIDIGPAFTL